MKTTSTLLCVLLLVAGGCANNIDDLVMCQSDADCPGGYCHDTDLFCVSGARQCLVDSDCVPPTTICGNGQCIQGCGLGGCDLGLDCNPATGRCRFLESCIIDSQCDPPDLVCVAEFCEPGCGITGCPDGFCDPYSGHCQGSTACSSDGDCAPPVSICEGDVCVPGCTITGCEGTDQCNQISGRCVPVGGCSGDQDCNPPSTICESTACVPGCTPTSCGAGYECNPTTGRCDLEGGCTGDQDCNPPSTICESTVCVAGCTPTSCGAGQQCNATTGRCETATLLADGADCTAGSQCLSGFCMMVEVYHNPNWVTFNVCSRACCTEDDCGLGFACMYHHGAKMCIPDSIYPPGYTFTQSAGQPCGAGGPYCRSGFCNPYHGTCSRTCCESSHCGIDACVWYHDDVNEYMFELCANAAGLPVAPTGSFCSGPDDCTSMICIANQCADMCCTNSDCPGGYRCAQVLGQSTNPVATTACVPGNPGSGADGAACTVGDAPSPHCQSGLCAGGTCRSPCCGDLDCVGGAVCLPVPSGFDLNNDGVSEFVRACVP